MDIAAWVMLGMAIGCMASACCDAIAARRRAPEVVEIELSIPRKDQRLFRVLRANSAEEALNQLNKIEDCRLGDAWVMNGSRVVSRSVKCVAMRTWEVTVNYEKEETL